MVIRAEDIRILNVAVFEESYYYAELNVFYIINYN